MFLTKAEKIEKRKLIFDYGFIQTNIVLNLGILNYLIVAIKKKGFKTFIQELLKDRCLISEAMIDDGFDVVTKELIKKASDIGANSITCLDIRVSVINNADGSRIIVIATGVAQKYEEEEEEEE